MQQLITIVLPVYNVEPYLRPCLESVVRQTVQDLQIICVNDGSTDHSRDILAEYAAKDSRFTIIDQVNQGGGSARNTALPYIRGKYTYFLDPDDLIHLELCEKTAKIAENTNADAVYFRLTGLNSDTHSPKFDPTLPLLRTTPQEKSDLISYFGGSVLKLWRSEFLLKNNIRFSEGKRPYNDVFQNWKGGVLAERIAVLNEILYFRRNRPGSYQQTIGPSHFIMIDTMNDVKKMLEETGQMHLYADLFLGTRLDAFRRVYFRLPPKHRPAFRTLIRSALTDADRAFIQSASREQLSRKTREFSRIIEQNHFLGNLKLAIMELKSKLGKWLRTYVFVPLKPLESFFRAPGKVSGSTAVKHRVLTPSDGMNSTSSEKRKAA